MDRWHGVYGRPAGLIAALGASALVLGLTAAANAAPAEHATDRPAGFLYGTDSWPIAVKGPPPYPAPVLGSPYGGYVGMTGNVFQWQGCGDKSAWSSSNFKGFTNYIAAHSSFKAGVYSAPSVWAAIFGTGTAASVNSTTYEWTYEPATSHLSPRPTGWCLRGTSTCAQFFGGVTSGSSNAVMWQWSGGGGTFNGVGDFDQIEVNRTP